MSRPIATRPLHLRELRAQMEIKELSLLDVSRAAGVEYTFCSRILNGREIHAESLEKIRSAIKAAPQPKEAAVA